MDRPILMSAPMVRALLNDTKTQTRRVMKPQPHHMYGDQAYGPPHGRCEPDGGSVGYPLLLCPYGQPGDRLWVREAWRTTSDLDKLSGGQIAEACIEAGYMDPWAPLQWEADLSRRNWVHTGTPPPNESEPPAGRYRHARFMPRWASRITLEITEVRVQRLQAITEMDAYTEGIDTEGHAYNEAEHAMIGGASSRLAPSVHAYACLWDSINGPGSWDANPWVWAISFRRAAS